MVRDLDIAAPDPRDGRRLEIVVDGLPLVGGAQFAVDTTLVSIPWSSGLRWRSSGPSEAAQGKNPPEIYPPQARARLVVLASEGIFAGHAVQPKPFRRLMRWCVTTAIQVGLSELARDFDCC